MITRSKAGIFKPKLYTTEKVSFAKEIIPKSAREALTISKAIRSKWIFKIKKKLDGSIASYKRISLSKKGRLHRDFQPCCKVLYNQSCA